MSLYDDASLIMYPSGYKADKIYSLKPTDGSGDLTFTRASTATRVNENGLVESVATGVPRIDYTGGGCGKLLLEPQRTNKLINSNDFSSYSKIGTITTTPNYGVSPSGATDSTRVIFSADSALYVLSVHSGTDESESIYIKGTAGETIKFGKGSNVGAGDVFTLNGDWQRLKSVSITGNQFTINTFSGVTARDVEIYGAQLEQGYTTSYIPTAGATATRVSDESVTTGLSSLIGQTEGTMFLDFNPQTLNPTSRFLSIENLSSTTSGWMGVFAAEVSGTIRFRFYGDGWDFNSTLIIQKDTRYKIAVSYKNGVQTSAYVNGNLINNLTASLSGKSFQKIRLSEAEFGVRGDADFNNLQIFPTALSDTELAELTTL